MPPEYGLGGRPWLAITNNENASRVTIPPTPTPVYDDSGEQATVEDWTEESAARTLGAVGYQKWIFLNLTALMCASGLILATPSSSYTTLQKVSRFQQLHFT
jgi:hypothetical protein